MKSEYMGDLHVHSRYSPSAIWKGYACQSKVIDILKAAKKQGHEFIAITDHNRIKGTLKTVKAAKKMGIVAIPGIEISSNQGHILAYNITEIIKKKMDFKETIEKIHNLGGLAVCAHPLLSFFGVGQKRIKYFDGVECINGRDGKILDSKYISKKQFVTGGSDAHTIKEIGNVVTIVKERVSKSDDLLELLRKRKSSFGMIRETKKISGIIFPQLKNIKDYFIKEL